MLTSAKCWERYGDPTTGKHMTVWHVPDDIKHGAIPGKIYCNVDMVKPLEAALRNVVTRGLLNELKTFDGCFCIRKKRGSGSMSLHAWGVAIDVNAVTNAMGKRPTLTPQFVECFTDAGFEWGGSWSIPDGMHFQLRA